MNELEQAYLAHHGILGQRWNHRNGPPYPLDAGDHSKSEEEAGYKKSLGGGRNEELYDRKAKKKEAKRVTKQLNKLDQDIAYKIRDYNEADDQLSRLSKKAAKRKAKGKELSNRDQKIVERNAEKLAEADAAIKRGQKEVSNILDSIDTKEFNVKEQSTYRNVKRGSEYAAEIIAATAGSIIMPAIGAPFGVMVITGHGVKGTDYKVKAKSDRQKAKEAKELSEKSDRNLATDISNDKYHSKYFTRDKDEPTDPDKRDSDNRLKVYEAEKKKRQAELPKSKEARIERAKKDDKWDIDFLETIQNTAFFEEDNTQKMLKEYSKYLDNPTEYRKNMRLAQS